MCTSAIFLNVLTGQCANMIYRDIVFKFRLDKLKDVIHVFVVHLVAALL